MKRYDNLHVRNYSQQRKTYMTMSMLLNEIDRYARILYMHHEEDDIKYKRLEIFKETLKTQFANDTFKFDPLVYRSGELDVYTIPNHMVMAALFRLLVKGLSPYFNNNCCSKFNGDIPNFTTQSFYYNNYEVFYSKVKSWFFLHGILIVECQRTLKYCKSRLIEKFSGIVDPQLLSLIEKFIDINHTADFVLLNPQTGSYKYKNVYEISNDSTPNIFTHHYGTCSEKGFIPQPYQSLRYELFNYLLDDVDRGLESKLIGMDYARYYEYILIPIKGLFLTTPIPQVVANTVITINEIMHNCQFPMPMIELAGKGYKFESFKEGFRVRVQVNGSSKISYYRMPIITGMDQDVDCNGEDVRNVDERIDDDS
jgi:hypothetical protein